MVPKEVGTVRKIGLMWSKTFFEEREEAYYQLKPNFKGKTLVLIEEALGEMSFEVISLNVDEPLDRVIRKIHKEKIDFAFNLSVSVSGTYNQSVLPSVLDALGIPYLGSNAIVHSFSLDRVLLKLTLRGMGIPTPSCFLFTQGEAIPENLDFPVVIKPRFRTTKNPVTLEAVSTEREDLERKISLFAEKLGEKLVVERLILGKEIVVGMWGNGPQREILPFVEVNLGKNCLIWDSQEKWRKGYVEDALCPSSLSEEERDVVERMVVKICQELDIRDFATFHLIFAEKEEMPFFFEMNSLPNLYYKHSAFPRMCETTGVGYKEMIQRLVGIAQERLRNVLK